MWGNILSIGKNLRQGLQVGAKKVTNELKYGAKVAANETKWGLDLIGLLSLYCQLHTMWSTQVFCPVVVATLNQ